MAMNLKDLVVFLLSEYPRRGDLTRARLAKLFYLVDVEWAWRFGEQLTSICWIWEEHGPFVRDFDRVIAELQKEGRVRVHPGVAFSGNPKRWYEWTGPKEEFETLLQEAKSMIKKVIEDTSRLGYVAFESYVYQTPPIKEGEKYGPLNVVEVMKRRRRTILEKARKEAFEKYDRVFTELAKL